MTYTRSDEVIVVTDSNGNYRNALDWSENQWMAVEEWRLLPKKDWKVFDGVESDGCMCSEAESSVDSDLKTVTVERANLPSWLFEKPDLPCTMKLTQPLEFGTNRVEAESSVSTEKSLDGHYKYSFKGVKLDPYRILDVYGITNPAHKPCSATRYQKVATCREVC